MVGVFRTDLFRHSNGTLQSYFGAKPLSIGITQRTPERARTMSSSLCEEAMERIADEQNPLNKKGLGARTQAACLNSSVKPRRTITGVAITCILGSLDVC